MKLVFWTFIEHPWVIFNRLPEDTASFGISPRVSPEKSPTTFPEADHFPHLIRQATIGKAELIVKSTSATELRPILHSFAGL